MEIKYTITKEDYIKFNLYNTVNSPLHKKTYDVLESLFTKLDSLKVMRK